jgi:RNA polymerase sigma-70 factor, ECF subfamily
MRKTVVDADAKAVRRCLRGQRSGFDELVTRYRAIAVGVALSICREHSLAEDAAQEAFIMAFRKLKQLSRPESFCAWLMNIVRNAALRVMHNAVRHGEVLQKVTVDSPPEPTDDRHLTLSLEVADVLARVDDDARQMLTMKYLEGMTCAEIAAALEVPIGTVTSKMCRVMGALREEAEREERQ